MELIVKEYAPQPLVVENYEELKAEITSKVALYKAMVYTDETIKQAKADRALLNKFTAALESKRKEIKKQCLAPYESFEKQIKELVGIVGEPVQLIDEQVKGYEERQKAEKLETIKEYFADANKNEWLVFESIFDNRWLNASFSMKKVQEDIDAKLAQIDADLKTLAGLSEFSFEAVEVYKTTLDINRAIAEGQRLVDIQKRKEEAARRKAEEEKAKAEAEAMKKAAEEEAKAEVVDVAETEEPVSAPAPDKQWIKFEALLSMEDATALAEFFNSRNINFRPI